MADFEVSDAEIAALSQAERQTLIWRLSSPTSHLVPAALLRRMRRRRLTMMIGAVVVLIPWIGYLATTLPDRYVARNWSTTWVGFDLLLLAMFALTAVLGLLRRQLLLLTAFGTGMLLVCDAWFDVTTATSSDRWLSIASAVFVELPVAVLLISSAVRLLHLLAERLWALEPGMSVWNISLPSLDLFTVPDGDAADDG